jgi:chemotaxis protein MotB
MIGENQRQEIIIIKRGGEGEEGHHGGAWKIAFADFMTAMMALFLVLWLVNAANEETKKAVASYFNPVKLVDRNQSRKGLDEQSGGPSQGEQSGSSATVPSEKPAETEVQESQPGADGAFFNDPFASLEKIADAEHRKQAGGKSGGGRNSSEVEGEADPFPDPFDPKPDIETPVPKQISAAQPQSAPLPQVPAEQDAKMKERPAEGKTENVPIEPIGPAAPGEKTAQADTKPVEPKPEAAREPETEMARTSADQSRAQRQRKIEALSKMILEDIQSEIAIAFDDADMISKALTVKAVEDGVLISVTDVLNYPMFEIGSAVPRGQIVLAMEKIGQVLAKQTGPLRIYGHTDARQYRSGSGDNWQLSSQRALAAYYMLGRAGLDERRVTQVAGFADRVLREAADPNADANRRIEILLEVK